MKDLLLKGIMLSLIGLLLAGVFSLYLSPDFVMNVANQVWFCIS